MGRRPVDEKHGTWMFSGVRMSGKYRPVAKAMGYKALREEITAMFDKFLRRNGVKHTENVKAALVGVGLLCPECGARSENYRCTAQCGRSA